MAGHDNYDKDILKALQKIANSLDKIEKHLNSKSTQYNIEKTYDVVEKCSNCKFYHFSGDEEPCKSCLPKTCSETGTKHMTGFQKKGGISMKY